MILSSNCNPMSTNFSQTIDKWLAFARAELAEIATANLDSLVLLEDCLHKDRAYLLAHPEYELTTSQVNELTSKIERRAKHVPLAYIRGKTEFYGREFIINQDVLEPRPETETMIELARELRAEGEELRTFVDVGTGSGAIIITVAIELGAGQFIGIDTNPKCLKVARANCEKHKATVDLVKANLLDHSKIKNLESKFCLLANLPYVPDNYTLNNAAMNEPRLAIFGGGDGLNLYREMFLQITSQRLKPSYILTESLPFQHAELAKVAKKHGYAQVQKADFIQVFALADI